MKFILMHKLKIFVSAYACEPGLGSEIGVGWHWVLEMSKYYELWVLTRESNRRAIELWRKEHPGEEDIHFLYFDLPKWARFWKKGLRGVRAYYAIWQACTNRIVKRTMQREDIRVFHHLTYGNALWRVSGYGQRQFFVWGPVGGLETIPEAYSKHYAWAQRCKERVRGWVVQAVRWDCGFRERCRRADLILCKTEITREALPEACRKKAVLFTDVAAECADAEAAVYEQKEVTEFITVGRLDAWRGFDLAIEAVARAVEERPGIRLTVVGSGGDEARLRKLVELHALQEAVTFVGKVSMEEYKERMRKADVVVNAALKEGAVTVSFDSLSMGKPLICLDTTGYTRCLSPELAVRIPRGERNEVIGQLGRAMVRLTDVEERRKLGCRARERAGELSWERHGQAMREAIERAYYGRRDEG